MHSKNIGKFLIIFSFLIFIANFFTLANLNFTQNKTLTNFGSMIGVVSFTLFCIGLIVYIPIKIKKKNSVSESNEAISLPSEKQKCPRWYRLTKLWIGLFIILDLYLIFPLYIGFVFLNRPGSGIENGPLIMKIFFGYFVTLTQYVLPLPFGVFVWPVTAIGIGLLVFHKKYWRVVDIVAIIILICITVLGFKTMYEGYGQKNKHGEDIKDTEKIHSYSTNNSK